KIKIYNYLTVQTDFCRVRASSFYSTTLNLDVLSIDMVTHFRKLLSQDSIVDRSNKFVTLTYFGSDFQLLIVQLSSNFVCFFNFLRLFVLALLDVFSKYLLCTFGSLYSHARRDKKVTTVTWSYFYDIILVAKVFYVLF